MANMTDCMLRNLQRFVQQHLMGLVSWSSCEPIVPADGDGDVVEIGFDIAGTRYYVRVESSEFAPPMGRIIFDGRPVGVIDEKTWDKVAQQIKDGCAVFMRRESAHGA